MKKSPAISVEDTGGRNTSRPIQASADSLYIAPNDHTKHGALLSDIDVHHKSGKSQLSLKYGNTYIYERWRIKSLNRIRNENWRN